MNYKEVDSQYIEDKIMSGQYQRQLIQKVGLVTARILNVGEEVKIYYYNEIAEIATKKVKIDFPHQLLVTKTINGKEYNSIMNAVRFHKSYRRSKENSFGSSNKSNTFIPLIDPVYAYEVDENIEFTNVYDQRVKLCPGDFVIPYNASHKDFYSIYNHNFQDNYQFALAAIVKLKH